MCCRRIAHCELSHSSFVQLPSEALLFEKTKSRWRGIMKTGQECPLVLELCTTTRILTDLATTEADVRLCEKGLMQVHIRQLIVARKACD
jgi:hypothetical protein